MVDRNPFAFPAPADESYGPEFGMTLRDWFAGQAVIGLQQYDRTWLTDEARQRDVAKTAYALADALLIERAK